MTIMKLRSFASTKGAVDRAKTAKEYPTGKMAEVVTDIMFDEVRGEGDG